MAYDIILIGDIIPSSQCFRGVRTPVGIQGRVHGADQVQQSTARMLGPLLGLSLYAWP
jgi:hypothetical protein